MPLDTHAEKLRTADRIQRDFLVRGVVAFDGITVGRILNWYGISPDSDITLDLRSARVGALDDEEKSWPKPGNLLLDGFTYDGIYGAAPTDATNRIAWLSLQPTNQFLPQPYEQLASVLRRAGHEDDAREVLIAENRDRAGRVKGFRPIRCWYWLLDETIRYGYRPWRAFWESAAFVFIGTILFKRGHRIQLITPTNDRAYFVSGPPQVQEFYPRFNAFTYSLDSFVPLIRLRVAEYWLPNANLGGPVLGIRSLKWGAVLRFYLWFHIIAGWVLTTLWVGALVGLIKN